MWKRFAAWACLRLQDDATMALEQELNHHKEMIIPKLERQIKVLEHENMILALALERDRKRVQAEIAVHAKNIGEVGT